MGYHIQSHAGCAADTRENGRNGEKYGMKRWIAWILAAALLLACFPAAAQNTVGMSDADIQESMISREDGTESTLGETLVFFITLLQDEEIQDLFQIQDVKDLVNEGAVKVLVWMIQNRPVTIKILAEFGMSEEDIRCVEIVWDSADRIAAKWDEYAGTEDGKQLNAEIDAVRNDPELAQGLTSFLEMITSEDFLSIVETIAKTVTDISAEEETDRSAWDMQALGELEAKIDTTTVTGGLFKELLTVMQNSPWGQESLPEVLHNENLKNAAIHLSRENEFTVFLKEEVAALGKNPEVNGMIRRLIAFLSETIKPEEKAKAPEEPEEGTNTAKEEVAP